MTKQKGSKQLEEQTDRICRRLDEAQESHLTHTIMLFILIMVGIFGVIGLVCINNNTTQPVHVTNKPVPDPEVTNQDLAMRYCTLVNQTYIEFDNNLCATQYMQVKCYNSKIQQVVSYCVRNNRP